MRRKLCEGWYIACVILIGFSSSELILVVYLLRHTTTNLRTIQCVFCWEQCVRFSPRRRMQGRAGGGGDDYLYGRELA